MLRCIVVGPSKYQKEKGVDDVKIERGDVVLADLTEQNNTSIQAGVRPVVVVSNDKANTYSPIITITPLTRKLHKKRYLPTHVFITYKDEQDRNRKSLALAEQITSIPVDCILEKYGHVNKFDLYAISKALGIQTGLIE